MSAYACVDVCVFPNTTNLKYSFMGQLNKCYNLPFALYSTCHIYCLILVFERGETSGWYYIVVSSMICGSSYYKR